MAAVASPTTPKFDMHVGFNAHAHASPSNNHVVHVRPKLHRIEELFTGAPGPFTPQSSPNPSMLVHHSPAAATTQTFSPAMTKGTPMILHSPVLAKLSSPQPPGTTQHHARGGPAAGNTPVILHTPVLAMARSPNPTPYPFPGSPIGFADYFARPAPRGTRPAGGVRTPTMTRARAGIQSPYIWPPYVHGSTMVSDHENSSSSDEEEEADSHPKLDSIAAVMLKSADGPATAMDTQGNKTHIAGDKPSPILTTTKTAIPGPSVASATARVHFNDIIEEVPNSPSSPRSGSESKRGRSKVRGTRGSSAVRSQSHLLRPGLRRTLEYRGYADRCSGLGVSTCAGDEEEVD